MPNKKISQFTTVGSINSDDVFLINQTGTTNTVTMNTVSASINNNISNKFIQKPAIVSGGEVLTYNGSTSTWVASAAPIPAGCVMMWTSSTLPTGWIECNGQSTASYPNLAAVCGANVPDLRGEFVRGWDHGKGTDPTAGRAINSTQGDAFESHSHMLPSSDPSKAISPYGWADGQPSTTCEDFNNTVTSTSRHITSPTGGTETRPRNVALMYIIKT